MAFLSFDWDYEIVSQYYAGMESYVAETQGMQVVVFSAFGHYHKRFSADKGSFRVFDLCNLAHYDGLVIQSNRVWDLASREEVVRQARELGMPVVSINYDLPNTHVVGTNNRDAMFSLVNAVLADGSHARPAFVNGLATSVEAQARARGYYDACAAHGIQDPGFYQATWQIEDGRRVAEQMLADPDGLPDVIFCCNDDLAIGVQETLQKHGVRIPEDVCVSGFDDREISRSVSPRMTTVNRDYAAIGKTALRAMDVLLAGGELAHEVFSPARNMLRESCGYEAVVEQQGDTDLYSLGNTLKRFYEVLNDFQACVFDADSLPQIADVCERFSHYLRCARAFLTISDAYLHHERGQDVDSYHAISHLLAHSGDEGLPPCNDQHIYRSFSSSDILPPGIMDDARFYVVYPLRRGTVCMGTLVTDGLSPIMQYGFLTFCLTILSLGILSVRNMGMLREANSRLDDLYVHDELTGLFNRFGLERFGAIEYERMLRNFGEAQLIFVDVDNMKGINDGFGHDQGDDALRSTADVIRRATLGQNAFAMRYGGDEFLLISQHNLIPRLEEELALIKSSEEKPYDLSLSMGAVTVVASDHLGIDEAIRKADDKMYGIKRQRKARRESAT